MTFLLLLTMLFSCENTMKKAEKIKEIITNLDAKNKFSEIEEELDSTFLIQQLEVTQIADSLLNNTTAKIIVDTANYAIKFIQVYKDELNKYVEEEQLRSPLTKDYIFQMEYSLEQGNAYQLGKILNEYVIAINTLNPQFSFKEFALDADEIDEFKNDENMRGKDFAQLTFDHTPLVAANTILSQLMIEVSIIELKALEILKKEE